MPREDWGWRITPEELESWIVHQDEALLVVNKPGLVVCHPSKHGPWSSLIGAAREYLGQDCLHMPSRLDRETSGIVVLARNPALGSRLQRAIERRHVEKIYYALLCGRLEKPVAVDQPLGADSDSAVIIKRSVQAGGQEARTEFEPVVAAGPYTLARIRPRTGRLHQIRVHAAWLGHPVAGDKIYGPDERLFLEFIASGYTAGMAARLPFEHHALHAATWRYADSEGAFSFEAPLPAHWEALVPLPDVVQDGRTPDPHVPQQTSGNGTA